MLNPFKANNLDEVVFANRNKAYGAYAIRKQYDANVTRAMLILFGSVAFLFLLGVFLPSPKAASASVIPHYPVNLDDLVIEVVLPPALPAASSPPPASATSANGNYRVEIDRQVTQPVAPLPAAPVNLTPSGNAPGAGPDGLLHGSSLPGALPGYTGPASTSVITVAEFMPVFDGGRSDLYEYLGREIVYPQRAIAAGVSGKVIVSFDIDTEGNVTNVNVVKGIGFGCDEEAVRVVRNMPRWKPASQNGNKVVIRMSLPIQFETVN